MDSKTIFWILVLGLTSVALVVAQIPLQIKEEIEHVHRKGAGAGAGFGGNSDEIDIFNDADFRLGEDLVPTSYKIEVITILDNPPSGFSEFTAPGYVEITFDCKKATSAIKLNAVNISIAPTDVKVKQGSTTINAIDIVPDQKLQFITINLDGELQVADGNVITIKYTAEIPESTIGLYRAEYTDSSGNQQWLATTQFETVGFRKMTPGFDEPRFKAKFTIAVCRPGTLNSFSNTPIQKTGAGSSDGIVRGDCPSGYVWDLYYPTEIMSSYLIALVVSNFARQESIDQNFGKPVGICGPPHLINDKKGGVFAANAADAILKAFEDAFGPEVAYPFAKMDSVAIPRKYFQFGAMENWGLNTYKDNLLLYFEGESEDSDRGSIANILSHELAHQWFGNLVTANYWSHIWLNEGFATYMAHYGMQETYPEYENRARFLNGAVQSAMLADAREGSHSVINTATQDNITSMSIFDDISYSKGGSLIRMMEGFLGEDTLFEGLKNYLQQMKYKPAAQDDLFEHVGKIAAAKLPADLTLKQIMDTWTLQKGYPLVRVSVGSESKVYISQEKFRNNIHISGFGNADPKTHLDPNDLWEVPIAIATQTEPNFSDHSPKFWLGKNVVLQSHPHNTSNWIIVNPEGYGYYRVLYDTQLTDLIQQQLDKDHTKISLHTKSQLLNDYFNLYKQGYVQLETALGMTKFLVTETSHLVWTPVLNELKKFLQIFSAYDLHFATLQSYLGPKVDNALDAVQWTQGENEHGINVTHRAALLSWACSLERPKCKVTTRDYFNAWVTKGTPVPLELQSVVYCAALANGNYDDFQIVLKSFKDEKEGSDASLLRINRLLTALTCSRDVETTLKLARDVAAGEFGKHTGYILQRLVENPANRKHGLGVLYDNWEKMDEDTIKGVVLTASNYQSSQEDLEKHLAFAADILIKDTGNYYKYDATFQSVTRGIQANMKWVSANLEPARSWFFANSI